MKILFVLATLSIAFATPISLASDSLVYSDGPINGSFAGITIKRSLLSNGAIFLNFYYTGNIVYSTTVAIYIRIHYLDGSRDLLVPMARYPGQIGLFAQVTNGCLVGDSSGCKVMGTDAMKHLLYWAVRPDRGGLNALSLEVAFVDSYGRWDSNLNKNYRFQFVEKLRF